MAKQKVTVKATLQYYVEPQDYIDQFREKNELEDEDDVDDDALLTFALEKFQEELEEGTISADAGDLTIDEVSF